MATSQNFIEFIVDQLNPAGDISYRRMFGGVALYCDGKVVALLGDDQLFVKPTTAGRYFIGNVLEAPPYPEAKNYFLIEDKLEDRDWLCKLIRLTAKELPEPKPKKKKIKTG